MAHAPTASSDTVRRRRWTSFSGIFFDEFAPDSGWIREAGKVRLPPLEKGAITRLRVVGEYRAHPAARGLEQTLPTLSAQVNGREVAALAQAKSGPWELRFDLPTPQNGETLEVVFSLHGATLTNALAWLGRITGFGPWQRFRRQNKNRQLRLTRIETGDGEVIYDFGNRTSPYSLAFARRHTRLGVNIVGFLTADLGVGESARCMVRAADAAKLPVAVVPLKLHCKNRLGDQTYAGRLQDDNPHEVNVVHLDPPATRDIDHHHGNSFRAGKYNIAYWAWELPDFPDAWVPCADYFHEIWAPSAFARDAIAVKSPVPVLTMPHAIAFARPQGDFRARFGLPADKFLFLCVFDFNSYAARKNPRAVIEAFRASGLARSAALVVKVQNAKSNPEDFAALQAAVADLPGTTLISETLPRSEIYQLEAACDCFVSLHRSEGFGLAIAECMYLGKPVISTDWSATAEFVDATNGCPVKCQIVTLEQNYGPYMKGSHWAEPDVAHATWWMKKLHEDRALASALGAAARHTIERRFAPTVIGARYRQRLESIAGF